MTSEQRALEIFRKHGVIVPGHFVGTSGRHLAEYVEKRYLYPHTVDTSELCRAIAKEFAHDAMDIDTVIAPEKGGIILAQWVAHHLTNIMSNIMSNFVRDEIWAVYAEKTSDGGFAIPNVWHKFISGRLVLVVEDTLTTGSSVRSVVSEVRKNGGGVAAVGALWNRGGVTLKDVGDVFWLFSLVNKKLDDWTEEECALSGPCSKGVPINTDLGKGAEFLARKGKEMVEEYERKHHTIPG